MNADDAVVRQLSHIVSIIIANINLLVAASRGDEGDLLVANPLLPVSVSTMSSAKRCAFSRVPPLKILFERTVPPLWSVTCPWRLPPLAVPLTTLPELGLIVK